MAQTNFATNDTLTVKYGRSGWEIQALPEAFSWEAFVLPVRKITGGWGGHVSTASLMPDVGDGVEYWVDPVNGNDNNSGLTKSAPLKAIATGLAKTDAGIVNIAPAATTDPFIYRNERWSSTSPASTKSGLIVRRWTDLREGSWNLTTAVSHGGTGWTQGETYTNTYFRTQATVAAVRDSTTLDAAGGFTNYPLAASHEACNDTEGSYFIDGTTLHVHALGSASPEKNVLIFLAETNAVVSGACPPIYIEGLNFLGGARPILLSNTSETTGYRHILKDCSFQYATDASVGNGLHCTGMPEVLLDNCLAAHNIRDGFNFAIRTSVIPKAILVNCVGKWNGNEAESTGNNNGSTMHSAGTIIRIGGQYFQNDGPNVADVEGSQSWNVGVSAHNSRRATPSTQAADFYNSAGPMWLHECSASGSEYSATVTSGGVTYVDRFTYDGLISGSLTTYQQA